MTADLKELPLKLKRMREATGMSQFEFARVSGVSQGQISNYETGRAFPGLESTSAMAHALGTTVADLIGEKKPSTAPPRPASKSEMAVWVIEAIGIDGFKLDHVRRILLDTPSKF